MDSTLIDLLVEEATKGNKCDKTFTAPAYSRALSSQFGRNITAENMRNRLRTIKKQYVILKDLVGQSGWGWNEDTQMLKVGNHVWKESVQAHLEAENFRCVSYHIYEKMGIVIGNDQPTGSFSEHGLDFEGDDAQDMGDGVEASTDQNFEAVLEMTISMSTQCSQDRAEPKIGSSSRKHGKKPRVDEGLVDMLGVMASKIDKLAEALNKGEEFASAFSDKLYKAVMTIDGFDPEISDDVYGF